MIAYIEQAKLLAGIPAVLHGRHAQRVGKDAWDVYHVRIEGAEPGSGAIGGLQADISQSTPQLVMQWLESVHCDGVQIQARDIPVLLGKDPFSLQLYQSVVATHFLDELSLIPTAEIIPTLRNLMFRASSQQPTEDDLTLMSLKHGYETKQQREDRMCREMEAVGIKVPGAGSQNIDWAQQRNTDAAAEISNAQDQWNAANGFAPTPAEPAPHPRDAFGLLEE